MPNKQCCAQIARQAGVLSAVVFTARLVPPGRGRYLAVWEYTAGWFEQETGLRNSTVLLPTQASPSDYTLINHCRWDRMRDILPALLFKKSFRAYVLANFYANRLA